MTYKYCSKCGAEGSFSGEYQDIKFCPYCGTELSLKKEVKEDDFY